MATQLEQHLAKMEIFPQIVEVETLNLCNARCSFCLQPGMRRARGRMADSLIEKIIRQVDRADSVLPFLLGEPPLDERLVDILTRVKERSPEVGTCIYTNGSLLNEKRERKYSGQGPSTSCASASTVPIVRLSTGCNPLLIMMS